MEGDLHYNHSTYTYEVNMYFLLFYNAFLAFAQGPHTQTEDARHWIPKVATTSLVMRLARLMGLWQ